MHVRAKLFILLCEVENACTRCAGSGQIGQLFSSPSAWNQLGKGAVGRYQCVHYVVSSSIHQCQASPQVDLLGSEVLWREAATIATELEPLYGLLQVSATEQCVFAQAFYEQLGLLLVQLCEQGCFCRIWQSSKRVWCASSRAPNATPCRTARLARQSCWQPRWSWSPTRRDSTCWPRTYRRRLCCNCTRSPTVLPRCALLGLHAQGLALAHGVVTCFAPWHPTCQREPYHSTRCVKVLLALSDPLLHLLISG